MYKTESMAIIELMDNESILSSLSCRFGIDEYCAAMNRGTWLINKVCSTSRFTQDRLWPVASPGSAVRAEE
jgi:hypothetical protein